MKKTTIEDIAEKTAVSKGTVSAVMNARNLRNGNQFVEGAAEIEHLFKLKVINYPFVLLADAKGIQANVVAFDNPKAIKKAVKFLMDHGHTRIVHFAGPPSSSHTLERIEGFRNAFSESTLAFREDMIVSVGSRHEESYGNTLDYFRKRERSEYPTAIVCFNDGQALAIYAALKELGIRVPGDISIIGNDDISYASIYPVPLTTIQAPQREIGERAAELLIRNIESSKPLPVERVVLERNSSSGVPRATSSARTPATTPGCATRSEQPAYALTIVVLQTPAHFKRSIGLDARNVPA